MVYLEGSSYGWIKLVYSPTFYKLLEASHLLGKNVVLSRTLHHTLEISISLALISLKSLELSQVLLSSKP